MPVDPLLADLVHGFAAETKRHCERATQALLELEREGQAPPERAAAWERLNRSLHTVKGSAGTLGLDDVAALAHTLEDLLAPAREQGGGLPRLLADALLRAVDVLVAQASAATVGQPGPDPGNAVEAVRAAAAAASPISAPRANGAHSSTGGPVAADSSTLSASRPASADAPTEAAPAVATPRPGDRVESGWRIGMELVTPLFRDAERVRELRLRLDERVLSLDVALRRLERSAPLAQTADARAALLALKAALKSDAEAAADAALAVEGDARALSTLQVGAALEPLHRLVRDVARQLGKEARLSIVGGELAVDRRVLATMHGPLVHLLRNAVDHGVEAPDLRQRNGKHPEGAITLRVEQQGNLLSVEVSDDGAGLDHDAIRARALSRGVKSADELAAIAEDDLEALILLPGFSTRELVSDLSGRGVGLDVVASEVRALHGHLQVNSRRGQGTTFLVTVPLELGTSPLLVVRVGEHLLGLPVISVETTRLGSVALQQTSEAMWLEHKGELLPVRDVGALLGIRPERAVSVEQCLLVVHHHGRRVAVSVDAVEGDRELQIRALPDPLRGLPAYDGAASLARGDLLLVLSARWLCEQRAASATVHRRQVLVVDDSLTARALHRAALEAGGFQVHLASSGRQAQDLVRRSRYDAVVCDVSMDDLDGLALTRWLRAQSGLSLLPVVLVSAADSREDATRAREAGADAYVSKRQCAAGHLLAEVLAVVSRKDGARS